MTSGGPPTVLVIGPRLSGAGAVSAALGERLTGCRVVEPDGLDPGRPADVVVFVVSAAAPISRCDAALLDAAARRTGAVVAAVTKIDVHRTWRHVLEDNRAALGRHAPRYRTTPWFGVAADPQIGTAVVEPLADAVRAALADGRRRPADGRPAVRALIRQTRLELGGQARAQAMALRADLQDAVAVLARRDVAGFPDLLRARVQQVADEFEKLVCRRAAELATLAGVAVADPPAAAPVWGALPRARPPAADDTLTVLFGCSFGAGAALTLGRLLTALLPAPAAVTLCGLAGAALGLWVVRARRLAAARAVLDRWVAEVAVGLRTALEERVLVAESALLAELAQMGARIPGSRDGDCAILPINDGYNARVNLL